MVPWKEGISGHASYAIHLVWQKMCSEQPLAAELPGPRSLGQQTRTTLGAPLRTGGRRRGTRLWSKSDGTRPLSAATTTGWRRWSPTAPLESGAGRAAPRGAGLPIKGAAYAYRAIVTGGGALFFVPIGSAQKPPDRVNPRNDRAAGSPPHMLMVNIMAPPGTTEPLRW